MDLLTAVGLTPVGSSTVHIYTQTVHRTRQFNNSNLKYWKSVDPLKGCVKLNTVRCSMSCALHWIPSERRNKRD